jgi:hypothetical protein
MGSTTLAMMSLNPRRAARSMATPSAACESAEPSTPQMMDLSIGFSSSFAQGRRSDRPRPSVADPISLPAHPHRLPRTFRHAEMGAGTDIR